MKKRILILGNSHLVVFGFRGELIERLVSEGYEVWTSFPNGPFGEGEKTAKEYNCHFVESIMDRRGTNPLQDIRILFQYNKIIKDIHPDIVLAYTVKSDVYGGIICRLRKIPFVPNITGLGKAIDEGGIVSLITVLLYRIAVKKARCVFFQNDKDKEFFDKNIKYMHGIVLPGSGVNLNKFAPLPYPNQDEPIRFIYVARVMKAKGIEQYLYAAHKVKRLYPNVEFHICGYCEENYKELLKEKEDIGEIINHGLVNDVRVYEEKCHCIVLPSFHPEGVSNVLLEAAANARPIITTDRVGCKETVDDGITGFIVKQRDGDDLVEKMIRFIGLDHDKKVDMGLRGRKKMEETFNRNIVVNEYMKLIKE